MTKGEHYINYPFALIYNSLKILTNLLRFDLLWTAIWINVPWGMEIATNLVIVLTKPLKCEASMLSYDLEWLG